MFTLIYTKEFLGFPSAFTFFLMVKKYFKCWVISLMAGILLNWDCIHKGLL